MDLKQQLIYNRHCGYRGFVRDTSIVRAIAIKESSVSQGIINSAAKQQDRQKVTIQDYFEIDKIKLGGYVVLSLIGIALVLFVAWL